MTYVSIGFTTNLHELLQTAGGPSRLAGAALVAAKVRQLVIMGGRHTYRQGDQIEWNMAGATALASMCTMGGCGGHSNLGAVTNRTLALWPASTRRVFLDYETGK